jgi:hypothetical protein
MGRSPAAVDEIFRRRLTVGGEALASLTAAERAAATKALVLLSRAVEDRARR